MTRCLYHLQITGPSRKRLTGCTKASAPGSSLCAEHYEQAMQRIRAMPPALPRPWLQAQTTARKTRP